MGAITLLATQEGLICTAIVLAYLLGTVVTEWEHFLKDQPNCAESTSVAEGHAPQGVLK